MNDTIKPLGYHYGGWSIRRNPGTGEYILSDHEGFIVDDGYLDRGRLMSLVLLLQHAVANMAEQDVTSVKGDEDGELYSEGTD